MKQLKSKFWWVLLSLAVLSTVAVLAQDDEHGLFYYFGDKEFKDCGLDKLNPHELNRLSGLVTNMPVPSFCEEAAIAFMEENDWKQLRILGAVWKGENSSEYFLLARYEYRVFKLRPSIAPGPPEPGIYWAKNIGSSWTVLYPNADEGSFYEMD